MVSVNTIPVWKCERLKNEYPEKEPNKKIIKDHREAFELDKTRVFHTFAFRRLLGKFQMISGAECDFNQNRLTHSLEVTSLAKNTYLKIIDYIVNDDTSYENFIKSNLFKSYNIREISFLSLPLADPSNFPCNNGGVLNNERSL